MTSIFARCALIGMMCVAGAGQGHATFKETILASFDGSAGTYPIAGLLRDQAGNLYGVAARGGTGGAGTVFKLAPPPSGSTQWTLTTLYNFSGPDGMAPRARLIMDAAGNLYGTTVLGGAKDTGTVFELSPPAPGATAWTEKLLLSFDNGFDGSYPYGGVVLDRNGNLYGTVAGDTSERPADQNGAVFRLARPAPGHSTWTETVINRFNGANGATPLGSLVFDAAGNLYGTASAGGPQSNGVVFELSPPAAGTSRWTETILSSFANSSINTPVGTPVFDASGNLYGTSMSGGVGCGAVFRLTPPADGKTPWTLKELWAFNGSNGCYPEGNLVFNAGGSLFGTTYIGNPFNTGLVFELTPPKTDNGTWIYTVVHQCAGPNDDGGNDGFYPNDDLVTDSEGILYGTEIEGTFGVDGLVFELSPASIAPR